MARALLVIGFGNTIRSDDGLGPALIDRLRDLDAGLDLIAAHQLDVDMVDVVDAHDVVLFVDACREGIAGTMRCRRITAYASSDGLAHHLTPQSLLAFVRQLHGSAPEAWLLKVAGDSFALGDALSPRLDTRLPFLASAVLSATFGLQSR